VKMGQDQETIDCSLKAADPDKPDEILASLYIDIGEFYNKMEEYQKALEHHQKGFEIKRSIYGESHSEISDSFNRLGRIYENLYEGSLNPEILIYGELHPRISI